MISTLEKGVCTAVFDLAGRMLAYKLYLLRKVTLRERKPLPIGVVIGDLRSTFVRSNESKPASGMRAPFFSYSASPTL